MSARQRITYRDAVILLAGKDTRLVKRIDKLLGGVILATSALTGPAALAFLEAKDAALAIIGDLVSGFGARLRGLTIPARGDRVRAATAVIAVTAFITATREIVGKSQWRELRIKPEDLFPAKDSTEAKNSFLDALIGTGLPTLEPNKAYDLFEAELRRFYEEISQRLVNFITGLALWDRLDETERTRLTAKIRYEVPELALQEHKGQLLELACEVPELAIWLNLQEHVATREAFRQKIAEIKNDLTEAISAAETMQTTLDGIYLLLTVVTKGINAPTARWRRSLAAANAYELKRPLLDVQSEQVAGIVAPTPEGGYINPDFRVAEAGKDTQASVEAWWNRFNRREDLQSFLSSYLISPHALGNPLLILGHPGAGKSVLTRVIAAKVPVEGFAVIRVVLRDVAANSSIISQIRQSFHNVIHEDISWPEFVESLQGALPVVILDGFDELLQATGVSQSDYLEKVRQFQESEESQGRPVVALVTSRTAVAHRARIPEGTLIVKLEPFDESQISSWISNWNHVNTDSFSGRSIRPLDAGVVMRHYDLACQPILLLMLAIYDAASNGLAEFTSLGRVSLYEQLLTSFVEREIMKDGNTRDAESLRRSIELELYQLSVAAFGMFNRGAQLIQISELDKDFEALGLHSNYAAPRNEFHVDLTSAQRTLGRFFFIHKSQARDDSETSSAFDWSPVRRNLGESFEFLHATFGEYLVARCSIKVIESTSATFEAVNPWQSQQSVAGEALLEALLSCESFGKRTQIITFITEIAMSCSVNQRKKILEVCRHLLWRANWPTEDISYRNYTPVQRDRVSRCATYESNLLLMTVAFAGKISLENLAPELAESPIDWWRSSALVWQGRLEHEAWRGFTRAIRIFADGEPAKLSVCLRAEGELGEDELRAQSALSNLSAVSRGGLSSDEIISINERLEETRQSYEMLLDQVGLLAVDLTGYIRSEFGSVAETSLGKQVEGLQVHPISGASVLIALALGRFDGRREVNDAFRLVIKLFDLSKANDGRPAGLGAVKFLVDAASRNIWHLEEEILYGILDAGAISAAGQSIFSHYRDLIYLWLLYVRSSLEKHAQSKTGRREDDFPWNSEIPSIVAKIFAMLDPNHAIGVHAKEMLEIVLAVEQVGFRIQQIAPDFGDLSEWLYRNDIASMSYSDPQLASDIIRIAIEKNAQVWLQEAALINVADFSDDALALLPQGYMEKLTTILENTHFADANALDRFRSRLQLQKGTR